MARGKARSRCGALPLARGRLSVARVARETVANSSRAGAAARVQTGARGQTETLLEAQRTARKGMRSLTSSRLRVGAGISGADWSQPRIVQLRGPDSARNRTGAQGCRCTRVHAQVRQRRTTSTTQERVRGGRAQAQSHSSIASLTDGACALGLPARFLPCLRRRGTEPAGRSARSVCTPSPPHAS